MLHIQREEHSEENHMLEGLTLHNIGVVHMLAGNFTLAFPAFREAVLVKKAAFGDNHPEVAVRCVLKKISTEILFGKGISPSFLCLNFFHSQYRFLL